MGGYFYMGGALKKTMHTAVTLEDNVDLMICVNSLVPLDAPSLQVAKLMRRGMSNEKSSIAQIVNDGLLAELIQTSRSMNHSRLELVISHYEHMYTNTSIILIESDPREPEMHLANTFICALRSHFAEQAFQQTRQMLRSRKPRLSAKLARHGANANYPFPDDSKRYLYAPAKPTSRLGRAKATLLKVMEDRGAVMVTAHHG